MKLRTSCCKPIALKKDIFRFAPLWVLYLVGLVMLLPNLFSYSTYDRMAYNFLGGAVPAFGVINLGYAFLCAQLLFGDLFNTKLCYSLHAMPFRRESWLATHLLAGLWFCLVPTVVACGLVMLALKNYWFLALYWLLASTIQFLFFFSLAALCAMLTGNRFALLAVYAIFNFFSLLLFAAINVLYIPSLEGVKVNFADFSRFCPVVQIFRYNYFQFTRTETTKVEPHIGTIRETFYRFDGLADGWGYLAILAVLAACLMGLCFWLYRKRHLESAGDFVAFSRMKAPACLVLTLCVTLVFAMLGAAFNALVIWLAVGLFIGFFGSLMLLERRLKVFRKKTFLHFGILAIAVAISMLAVEFDWFGIEQWLPREDKVASITISNRDTESNYYYGYDGYSTTVTEEEDIAQILLAHQDILNRLDEKNVSDRYQVYLTYTMKSGRVVRRKYNAPASGENYRIIRKYLHTIPNLLGFTDPEDAAKNIAYMYSNGSIPKDCYLDVLKALYQDAMDGYVSNTGNGEYVLEYNIDDGNGNYIYRTVWIDSEAKHLPELLKSPEVAMGYSDWDQFLANLKLVYMESSGTVIEKAHYAGLMEALRKDIQEGNISNPWEYVHDAPAVCYEYSDSDGFLNHRQIYIPKEATHVHAWLKEHQVS